MKYLIILLIFFQGLYAQKPYKVYPYTIESKTCGKESLENKFSTINDYDGEVIVSIVMLGHGYTNPPIVKIDKKIGKYISSKTMFVDKKSIGKIFYYEFKYLKEGMLTIKYNDLFNSSVYIK